MTLTSTRGAAKSSFFDWAAGLNRTWILAALLVLPAVFPKSLPCKTMPDGPVVHLSGGILRGFFQGGAAVFKGIPYAAPPIGDLRWRPPQSAAPWQGERDATQPSSACIQPSAGLGPFVQPLAAAYGATYVIEPVPVTEDCLYLNVWAPRWPAQGRLPVMVWLHGGSNVVGSGAQSTYDADSLAAHGVIVVTINYRLGVMGFFSHPQLTAESPRHSSGNYGLLDQLAALQWVHDNIAPFGGDPSNVTLFGELAGSIDAGVLVTSPLAAGLFRRVILESGPPFGLGPITTLAEAEAQGVAIAQTAPHPSTSALVNLRRLPAADLLRIANAHGPYAAPLVVDGWVVPQPPARAFASGSIQKVDMLVGLNGRELSAFRVDAAAAAAKAEKQAQGAGASDAVKKLADTARPLYGGWTYPAIAKYVSQAILHKDLAIDQGSNDMLMACPIGALAGLTRAIGQRVFVYKFDRSIPGKGESTLGAFHGLEIPYVFNNFADRGWQWLPFTDADAALSGAIEVYWTNFARGGDPNGSGISNWPAWENGDEGYMEFSPQARLLPQRHFSPSFCSLSVNRLRKELAVAR
jgi:para-nitrobenzyl esterase